MSEGGLFPWKLQRIIQVPIARYTRNPLPKPPDDMMWSRDEATREWRLVPVAPPVQASNNSNTAQVVTATSPPQQEDDWEILSENSSSENDSSSVFVKLDANAIAATSIQRSPSNSTIDSTSDVLGPLGQGVLGVDYVEHVVLPTDTFQGICLAYKVHATKLRQANHFSGTNLFLAPKKLVIPLSKQALRTGFIRVQDTDAKEYKMHAIVAELTELSTTEARAYLELADWNLQEALKSAKEDLEWERGVNNSNALKAGQIRITLAKKGSPFYLHAQGAGFPTCDTESSSDDDEECEKEDAAAASTRATTNKANSQQGIMNDPNVATATAQHGSYGVELNTIKPSTSSNSSSSRLAEQYDAFGK